MLISGRRIILVCTDQTTRGSCKVVRVTSGGRTSQSVPSTICQKLSKACFSCPVTTASWETRRLIPVWWVGCIHSGWNSWILGCTWNTTVREIGFRTEPTFDLKTMRYQPRRSAVSLYAGKCSCDYYADYYLCSTGLSSILLNLTADKTGDVLIKLRHIRVTTVTVKEAVSTTHSEFVFVAFVI